MMGNWIIYHISALTAGKLNKLISQQCDGAMYFQPVNPGSNDVTTGSWDQLTGWL